MSKCGECLSLGTGLLKMVLCPMSTEFTGCSLVFYLRSTMSKVHVMGACGRGGGSSTGSRCLRELRLKKYLWEAIQFNSLQFNSPPFYLYSTLHKGHCHKAALQKVSGSKVQTQIPTKIKKNKINRWQWEGKTPWWRAFKGNWSLASSW